MGKEGTVLHLLLQATKGEKLHHAAQARKNKDKMIIHTLAMECELDKKTETLTLTEEGKVALNLSIDATKIIFKESATIYNIELQKRHLNSSLKEFTKEALTTKKGNKAATILENEKSMLPEAIKELVEKTSDKQVSSKVTPLL